MTLECVACPGAGACGGQFTANTMAWCRRPSAWRCRLGRCACALRDPRRIRAGERQGGDAPPGRRHPPARHRTRKAFENAATIVAATGGSTNAGLHLPAMAHECGIEFDLFDVAAIFKRTPYIADLKPGGKYVAKDVYDIGGIPQIMRALLDGGFLHEDCMTVTGKTIKQNIENVKFNTEPEGRLPGLASRSRPTGGVVGLQGSLAPDGAIVKVAGLKQAAVPRPGARVRLRGGLLPRGREPRLQGRRRSRHPLRRPQGRPRHARDAVHHGRALRPGRGREGRAHHRRPLLRRHARLLHRPRRPRRRRSAGRSRWSRTATSSPSTPRRARSTSK